MRNLGILSVIVLIAVFGNTAWGMDKKAVDDLIKKMEKKVDPNGVSKDVKTQVSKLEMIIPAQQMKMNLKGFSKYPDKSRMITEIPGLMKSERVFNGKQCWESSPAMGIREITGKELDAIRFQTAMENPANKMRDIFAEIKVPDETVKVDKFDCYQFTCVPKKEYKARNVIMYVDKKDFLTRKVEMINDTQMGPIKTEVFPTEYKEIDKILVPMISTIKQLGMEVKVKVLEIKNNVKLDDSLFEKPKTPEAKPAPNPAPIPLPVPGKGEKK